MADKPAIPQKGESPIWYFYRQFTRRPAPVRGVDLRGRTAIVTGSNTGLGFEVSRQLLGLGLSRLILAVRSEEKGKAAAARLAEDLPRRQEDRDVAVIEVWPLDLSAYDSVVAFARRAHASLDRLDHVVLNAGMWQPVARTFNASTGHDETVQVNYLSTALLALLLLPVAKAKRAAGGQPQPTRITFVSSEVAGFTKFAEGRSQGSVPILAALDSREGKFDPLDRMFVGKLLQQFFVTELAGRVPPSAALVNACSPGSVYGTDFNRETPPGALTKFVWSYVGSSPSVGARMITDAAVNHGDETHGQFLSFQEVVGKAPIIYSPEGKKISEQLWKETMAEFAFANVEDILRDVTATES
ncbi:hypothetical protein SLS62_006522 [Diatrype stigma]|uniref:Uncharacterized protein n=1 Tax=Diatrype stigma TaxID=117547 RepID=A0AAN9URC7_9PEZI